MFSSKSFIVSSLTFRSLIHFDFIYGIRKCSNLIILLIADQFFIDYAKAFDCVDHKKTVENSERDGNTTPPDLPPEKSIRRTRGNSYN